MKKIISLISITFLLGITGPQVYSAPDVCTDWIITESVDRCDKSSGICRWNNWGHVNYRTDYKRRSCTHYNGHQWFEYTQTTYANGCC